MNNLSLWKHWHKKCQQNTQKKKINNDVNKGHNLGRLNDGDHDSINQALRPTNCFLVSSPVTIFYTRLSLPQGCLYSLPLYTHALIAIFL